MYDMKSNYFLSMVLATCVIVSGCSSVEKRTLAPDKKTNLLEITNTPETTNTPEITQKSDIEERRVKKPDYVADSNAYWTDVLRNQEKKEEIDLIVEWFKNIKYCEAFSVYSDGELDVWPDNKKTKKGLQREVDFAKIKNIVLQNSYDIRNNWYKDNTITILHRFKATEVHPFENPEIREIMGNYCLIYIGERGKKEKYWKKVEECYFSDVIFYE